MFVVLKTWKQQLWGNFEDTLGWPVLYASNHWQPFWKMAAMVIRMPVCNGPISRFILNILSYICTKFGAFITK